MMGQRVLLVGVGLLVALVGPTAFWILRKAPLPLGYVLVKSVGYVCFGAGIILSAWYEGPPTWMVAIAFASWMSARIFLIERARAPWFFWLKISLLVAWLATALAAARINDYFAPLFPLGLLVFGFGALVYWLPDIFRPKNAYITDDPASIPPAPSCPPQSPTNGR
jgi:hypothetical protein